MAPTRLLQVGCIGQLQMGYFFGLHQPQPHRWLFFAIKCSASGGCIDWMQNPVSCTGSREYQEPIFQSSGYRRTTDQQPIILPPHLNPQVESTMPRHPTKSICKTHIRGGTSEFTVCSAHRSRTSLSGEIGQILLFLEQTVASSRNSLLQHEQDLVHLTDRGRP